jgi:hypothetical protein
MKIAWAVLILTILLVLVLISAVNIRITYYRENKDDELIIILSALFGLVNIKSEFNVMQMLIRKRPGLKVKGEAEAAAKGKLIKEFGGMVNAQTGLEYYKKYKVYARRYQNTAKFLRKRIVIKKLEWDTVLGTGDAALTGISIGILWNVKTLFSSILNTVFKLKSLPDISIIPCFDGSVFRTHIDCILSVKIGHAITAGVIGLIARKKDGDKVE